MKAVVLFNLGGPDKLENVKPFLFNLFYDPSIINLPNPIRYILAFLISSLRKKEAIKIYESIGGRSPIYYETENQADAVQQLLGDNFRVFFAMRYWKPFAFDVINKIIKDEYEEVILIPLYPQYSTTTTGSFYRHWDEVANKLGLNLPTRKVCCYYNDQLFVKAHADLIIKHFNGIDISSIRFLFSAHGLPEKIIKNGDPYQSQIEYTAENILKQVPQILDYTVCYQSRVGPLKWIGPSTEEEIIKAGKENIPIAIVPISFVSEHSETLYELDYQYKSLAKYSGVPEFYRVPTLRVSQNYINSLSNLIIETKAKSCGLDFCKINCITT